jgi:cytochrome c556
MKQSFRALALLAAVFMLQASQAHPTQTRGEEEVDYRQSLYTVMAGNFHPLGAMAEGKMPFNAAEAKLRAERVAFLVPMLKEAFPADSNGVGHTAAKPEIWKDKDGFSKALQLLIDKSAALAVAANTGDADKVKAAVQETGKACKNCHDKFKVKDKD